MQTYPIAALVRGALELEETGRGVLPHRLPAWARAQCTDPQLLGAESQPAGVRLAFRTTATVIELDAHRTRSEYAGLPARPDGVFDLVVDGELAAQAPSSGGDTLVVDLATGAAERRQSPPGTVRFAGLSGAEKDVEIWLPHHERTELLELRADAALSPAAAPARVWIHYGSSISQGSNATHPTGTWIARSARTAGVGLVNLGFSGSALLDPFVARTIRDTPADAVSLELGINLVNTDLFRRRALGPAVHGFLDTIRDGKPDTPLLVVSSVACPIHEDTPGPGAFDVDALRAGRVAFVATGDPADVTAAGTGKLSLRAVREELAAVVATRADPHLTYLDGLDLLSLTDLETHPLPDALHPGPEAHTLMATRFTPALAPGGPLAP